MADLLLTVNAEDERKSLRQVAFCPRLIEKSALLPNTALEFESSSSR